DSIKAKRTNELCPNSKKFFLCCPFCPNTTVSALLPRGTHSVSPPLRSPTYPAQQHQRRQTHRWT
uniref:Uncharacterized protein n=1 Tax=Aegilops tauschii subsp. strangulata TaxID=200361 RepID=A0A453HRQ3_AEGTS